MRKQLAAAQAECGHVMRYTSRVFDMLNGFEIVAVRCLDCHKTLELTVKKLGGGRT